MGRQVFPANVSGKYSEDDGARELNSSLADATCQLGARRQLFVRWVAHFFQGQAVRRCNGDRRLNRRFGTGGDLKRQLLDLIPRLQLDAIGMDFRTLINKSLNETLSRTILTVSTTALAVLALLFFGGEVLRGFSIAMLWGIVIGTYSSLFIAAPLLYYIRPSRGGGDARSEEKAEGSRPEPQASKKTPAIAARGRTS